MALIENKKVRFDYEIGDIYEAGVELLGFEVKSLREKQGSLEGAYVVIRGGEAFLINFHIPPYQTANTPKEYDSRRHRRLLFTKKEIKELERVEKQKNLTIVPVSVYNKGRKVKISVGIAKGKKKYDKRDAIKRRESEREIRRSLKK